MKINIYHNKRQWKVILLIAAVIIGFFTLSYTNNLIEKLSVEERKKVELWAEGTRELVSNQDLNQNLTFVLKVIAENETVPVILTDENNNINSYRNLDEKKATHPDYLRQQLEIMKEQHEPIIIDLPDGHKNYIYYKDSFLLQQLSYYPFIQLGLISLFIAVSYLAFSTARKAEQNQVWVGMSKETAHQLGTPISSLMAWMEILGQEQSNQAYVKEIWKDITRLETIAQRFSKIGSSPVLNINDLNVVLHNAVNYMKNRASEKIKFNVILPSDYPIEIPLNPSLFEWVVENLCKNAVDAMGGTGELKIEVNQNPYFVFIDFTDNGKGIAKSRFKTVFQPGYTTKERGWGLGLSLAKRIIEQYHKGKIFIKWSEIGKGTTIRIILKKK